MECPSALAATLARRLLVESGPTGAVEQLGLNVGERDAARMQHDQKMVDEIGTLRDQPLAILADGGKRRLDRLLAEFLGAMGDPAVEQLAGVGQVGARL